VSAKDKATNKEQSMRIQPSGGLTEADIQKMVKEAEEHAGDDKARRELVEAKNSGEATIHNVERQLTENGDKISAADKTAIEQAVQALKDALPGDNMSDIAAKTQSLVQASMKIGEAMYASQKGGGDDDGSAPNEPGVVDAEFEEVDGQNKKSA